MRARQFLACAAVACMSSSGLLLAQSAAPKHDAANRVTVSGCVERADQMSGNSATTTVDSLNFVLIKPKPEAPTGTTGSVTADSASPESNRMYRLDGAVEELNPHVGQKVEISGTVAETATAPAGTTSATNTPRLRVESVKVLAPTCPR